VSRYSIYIRLMTLLAILAMVALMLGEDPIGPW
jgi:hypothetical protein